MTDWQPSAPEPGRDHANIRNASRPATRLFERSYPFTVARDDPAIGVIILTGSANRARRP